MSFLRVVALLVSLFFFSVFAVAQVSVPNCTVNIGQWAYNSLGQSPCTILGYMMTTCYVGEVTIVPIGPGWSYVGPHANSTDLCQCNTITYSLFCACAACQNTNWIPWSDWVHNCSVHLPPSTFPNPVPSGINVPHWVLLDVTIDNNWDRTKSLDAGDSPEFGPGSLIGPSSVPSSTHSSVPSSTHSSVPSSTHSGVPSSVPSSTSSSVFSSELPAATPTSSSSTYSSVVSGSNAGSIAGGVVIGGTVGLIIATAAIIFRIYLRRRPWTQAAVPADVSASSGSGSQPQPTQSDELGVLPSLSGPPVTMRLYNPGDPTTFPEYQSVPHSLDIPSQVTMPPNIGAGNTLADTQSSLPQAGLARGYHGLPTV